MMQPLDTHLLVAHTIYMATAHIIVSVRTFEATEDGALSGNEAVCSCGDTYRNSMSASEALGQGNAHADYMNKKEGK